MDDTTTDAVLRALGDERSRAIITSLVDGDGRSASELSDRLDIPRSTVYRRLDRLVQTPLVTERATLDAAGTHETRYSTEIDGVVVRIEEEEPVSCTVRGGAERDETIGLE